MSELLFNILLLEVRPLIYVIYNILNMGFVLFSIICRQFWRSKNVCLCLVRLTPVAFVYIIWSNVKQFLYGQFLCVLNEFFLSFFAFHYWPISIIFSKLCSHLSFSSYNLIISFSLITFYSFIYKSISSIIQIELCVFL